MASILGRSISLQVLSSLDIGDTVCDMHYGLHSLQKSLESPLKVSNHVTMPTRVSASSFLSEAVGRGYTNKMAVVVNHRMGPYGLVVTVAYSYDGNTFGMFDISEGNANRGD